jgi:hypothetical protein
MSVVELIGQRSPTYLREALTARVDEQASTVHAIYPTALVTLCNVPVRRLGKTLAPDFVPTCATCRETAQRFDAIDRSAPVQWFRDRGGGP